jgi:quinol monooxygenase YgiN
MGFVQIIRASTSRIEELEAAHDDWRRATEGERTTTRELTCVNRDVPGEYWIVVEFPDHDAAMRNNELPATKAIAEKMWALCDRPPEFIDLDVRRLDD